MDRAVCLIALRFILQHQIWLPHLAIVGNFIHEYFSNQKLYFALFISKLIYFCSCDRIYLSVTVGFLSSVPADSAVFYITFCFILQHQVCFQIQISSPPLDKFNSHCFASMGLFLIKTRSVFSGFIPAEGRLEERYGYVMVTSDSLERVG